MTKKRMMIQVDELERTKIEQLADKWGLSFSGVLRRLVREYDFDVKN